MVLVHLNETQLTGWSWHIFFQMPTLRPAEKPLRILIIFVRQKHFLSAHGTGKLSFYCEPF